MDVVAAVPAPRIHVHSATTAAATVLLGEPDTEAYDAPVSASTSAPARATAAVAARRTIRASTARAPYPAVPNASSEHFPAAAADAAGGRLVVVGQRRFRLHRAAAPSRRRGVIQRHY